MTSIPPPKPKSTRKRKRWLLVCAILSILMIGVGIPLVFTETPFWGGVVSLLGIFIGSVTMVLVLNNKIIIDKPNKKTIDSIKTEFEDDKKDEEKPEKVVKSITIGRVSSNDYVVMDSFVNRNHCKIELMQSGECYLEDLGSKNGTFVNGVRVNKRCLINRHDKIQIGHTMLDFINDIVPPDNTYLKGDLYFDRIELTEKYKAVIEKVEKKAYRKLNHPTYMTGDCHFLWEIKKKILWDEYGIAWQSPGELNPKVMFD